MPTVPPVVHFSVHVKRSSFAVHSTYPTQREILETPSIVPLMLPFAIDVLPSNSGEKILVGESWVGKSYTLIIATFFPQILPCSFCFPSVDYLLILSYCEQFEMDGNTKNEL